MYNVQYGYAFFYSVTVQCTSIGTDKQITNETIYLMKKNYKHAMTDPEMTS